MPGCPTSNLGQAPNGRRHSGATGPTKASFIVSRDTPEYLRLTDGLVYHAINPANNRGAGYFTPADHEDFIRAFEQTQKRHPILLFGYCLIST